MTPMRPLKLTIAGTYTESDAYPNVKHRIRLIEESNLYNITRYHKKLPLTISYNSRLLRSFSLMRILLNAIFSSILIVFKLSRDKSSNLVYLPYPATLLLWTISLLPSRYQPTRLVVDFFISVYDTVIVDRKFYRKDGFIASAVFSFEKRALSVASALIVDTVENADYYSKLFSIDRSVLFDIPISIDNQVFSPSKFGALRSQCRLLDYPNQPTLEDTDKTSSIVQNTSEELAFRILYIGTFVPLHNLSILCKFIREFRPSRPVEFIFIGDGQDAPILEQLYQDQANLPKSVSCKWVQHWQSSLQLREYIQNADICIGLLGTEGKSQRVWPIKNYLYMACGRPLITARSAVSDRLTQLSKGEYPPFIAVNPNSFNELKSAINIALDEPKYIRNMASAASRFHMLHHSDRPVKARLHRVFNSQI